MKKIISLAVILWIATAAVPAQARSHAECVAFANSLFNPTLHYDQWWAWYYRCRAMP
jgi:hypothetical protein